MSEEGLWCAVQPVGAEGCYCRRDPISQALVVKASSSNTVLIILSRSSWNDRDCSKRRYSEGYSGRGAAEKRSMNARLSLIKREPRYTEIHA